MKVFLLGATGNLGSRLVPALLTHNHTVVAFVRSSKKLESLLPPSVYQQIQTVIEGDAKDSASIKKAILDTRCNAVVTTAGVSAIAPWSKTDFPKLFRAVIKGVHDAGVEIKQPLRVWAIGGQGVLRYPGTEIPLSNYVPFFLEHQQNLNFLHSLSPESVHWSMLCPGEMIPDSPDLSMPTQSPRQRLIAKAGSPPAWNESRVESVPLLGRFLVVMTNALRYRTTLEQNADFIAADLEEGSRTWVGKTVGVIDPWR